MAGVYDWFAKTHSTYICKILTLPMRKSISDWHKQSGLTPQYFEAIPIAESGNESRIGSLLALEAVCIAACGND